MFCSQIGILTLPLHQQINILRQRERERLRKRTKENWAKFREQEKGGVLNSITRNSRMGNEFREKVQYIDLFIIF